MSIRTEKVASVIKKSLAQSISDIAFEYNAGLVTITSVRLTKDLHIAKVFISIFGGSAGPGEFMKVLDDRRQELRMHLAHSVRLKFAPELRFYLDDTLDQIEHIQKLLKDVSSDESRHQDNSSE